jgi:hypothetical protein
MGINIDTFEDTYEHSGQFVDSKTLSISPGGISKPFCHLCSTFVDDLNRHIFDEHRKLQTYVRVDNHVISKNQLFNTSINLIDIHHNFGADLDCEWQCAGKTGTFKVFNGVPYQLYPSSDLSDIYGEIVVKLGTGINQTTYKINVLSEETLRYDKLDQLFLNMQESYNYDPQHFVWSKFRSEIAEVAMNQPELIYLNALYDYLYSTHQEIHDHSYHSDKLIEIAYANLAPYSSLLALTVRTIIAFRLNWFSILKNRHKASFFSKISLFFTLTLDELLKAENEYTGTSIKLTSQRGILIDDFHMEYFGAILFFFQMDMKNLQNSLETLKSLYCENPNPLKKVKVELLSGRYYRLIGDEERAIKEYGSLSNHELFEVEVRELRR